MNELFGFAHLHKNFKPELARLVYKQDPDIVKNIATSEARKLHGMHRCVMREVHLKSGFIRFESSDHGMLYAKINLEHKTEDMLLQHFHNRFPLFHIVLEVKGVSWLINKSGVISKYNLSVLDLVKQLEIRLPKNELLCELDLGESGDDLWNKYYNSQYIGERRNLKLMKKMMPLKYREDGFETFNSRRCCKLSEFF